MVKHTLKILRCSHRKILKVCLTIFQHMHERVNASLSLNLYNRSKVLNTEQKTFVFRPLLQNVCNKFVIGPIITENLGVKCFKSPLEYCEKCCECLSESSLHSWYLLIQSEQEKRQNV